jgi:diguanylate cyclase (GGDEF)-like protein
MDKKRQAKGLHSIVVFIPTIVVISIFYVLILVSTILINVDTTSMEEANATVTECINNINNLQGGTSKLTATAISFAHMPYLPNPEKTLNTGALNSYMSEFNDDSKHPKTILGNLQKYDLDDKTKKLLDEAVNAAYAMAEAQAHAFRLINSISFINLPDDVMKRIPEYDISKELDLTDDEKQKLALELLLNLSYSDNQRIISENTRTATDIITLTSSQKNSEINQRIKLMRGFLWGSILLILISNLLLFVILFKKLVFPINNFSKRIDNNQRLETEHSLYEANHLAIAYNALLDRHKEFENELRNVAENDSLTGLPNRYCYNEFLKIPPEEKSAAVFVLDINNLKFVNDTYGHAKGDELIKNASLCIKKSFLDDSNRNCYRVGGDEFIAILENISKDDIDSYIQAFNDFQKEFNVSIAMGYSYTDNIKEVGYEKLVTRADKNMYKNKKECYEHKMENAVC